MRRLILALALVAWASEASAQVAFDACSESHTGTTGSTSEASFSWTHTPVGTPRGVVVFTTTFLGITDLTTSITYGGVSMTAISGGVATIDLSEDFYVKGYFLGASIPTGGQSVVVERTNNGTPMYAVACTVTASADTEVYTAGIALVQASTTITQQSVTDNSPGTNSLRFAFLASGSNATQPVGAASTAGPDIDIGGQTAQMARETTAGQGSRNIGFAGAAPADNAAVHLAVRESGGGGGGSTSKNRTMLGVGAQ